MEAAAEGVPGDGACDRDEEPCPTCEPDDSADPVSRGDCPQEGMGCSALVIHLVADKDPLGIGSRKTMEVAKAAEADGCATHRYNVSESGKVRHFPVVKSIRNPDRRAGQPEWRNLTDAERTAAEQQWKRDIAAESAQLWSAINGHHADLLAGVELGLFAIFAHGSSCSGADCGEWATGYLTNGLLAIDRRELETWLYEAAFRRVCEQVVVDASCYAGCSPLLGTSLNEAGVSECSPQVVSDCCKRAGWRGDAWGSSSKADEVCWYFGEAVGSFAGGPATVLTRTASSLDRDAAEGKRHELIRRLDMDWFAEHYLDAGYGSCCP